MVQRWRMREMADEAEHCEICECPIWTAPLAAKDARISELERQNSDLQKANVRLEERARRWEWASKGIIVADANMSELLKRACEFVKHAEWWATGDQAQRFREKLDAVGLAKEIEAELGIRNNVRS